MSERPSATAVRETYFNAVYPSTSNSGVLTAGLHAVEASGYERGRADERRRTLDELEEIVNDGTVVPHLALMQYIDKTREGLE